MVISRLSPSIATHGNVARQAVKENIRNTPFGFQTRVNGIICVMNKYKCAKTVVTNLARTSAFAHATPFRVRRDESAVSETAPHAFQWRADP